MHPLYRSSETYELVIYDVRIPNVAERLHRERAAWQVQPCNRAT